MKIDKNKLLVVIALLAIAVTGLLVYANSPQGQNNKVLSFLKLTPGLSTDAIAKKSMDYLNKSVLQSGKVATLDSAKLESGVVHLKIKIDGNSYDSYATLDGNLLFPEALTMTAAKTTAAATPATTQTAASITPANVAKVASTKLEAYVVSSCPFGIQMQRALSTAIQTAPSLANYVTVRYIGAVSGNTITSMHGDEEAQENLRQMCIRQEQPAKYWPYVACYIKKATGKASNGMPYGDSTSCQTATGVDTAMVRACVADPTRGLTYAKADFALDAKYNVSGSPTLILNGQTISEDAFGGRSADSMRNIICSSSSSAPAFCGTRLDATPATTSFSLSYAGTGATAAASSACAPAVQ